MDINKKEFFDCVRASVFSGKLKQEQVDSLNLILNECSANEVCDNRKIAYIIATAVHEVGLGLQPVREGWANTDKAAIAHVTSMFNKGIISKNYAIPVNGKSYFGRGFVQLTWDYNYRNAGDKLGVDLYNNPDLALRPDIAAKILVRGMLDGWFTGKRLDNYFNESDTDWVNARRIINGVDKAHLISGLAGKIYSCLNK